MSKAVEQELFSYFLQLHEAKKKVARISIEQYNQELQEAEAEYERGEYTSHEEFVKQIKKW